MRDPDVLGYVVVAWNQASGMPAMTGDFYDEEPEAHTAAQSMRAETKKAGRREQYTVHAVMTEELDDPEAGRTDTP